MEKSCTWCATPTSWASAPTCSSRSTRWAGTSAGASAPAARTARACPSATASPRCTSPRSSSAASRSRVVTRFVLAAILTTTAATAFAMARKPPKQDSPLMETTGQHSKLDAPGSRVVTDAAQWRALWEDIGRPAPAADFSKDFAVAAFAGTRNTGGYKIVFDAPVEENGAHVIRYAVVKPGKGMMVTMSLTQPYAVKLFPK